MFSWLVGWFWVSFAFSIISTPNSVGTRKMATVLLSQRQSKPGLGHIQNHVPGNVWGMLDVCQTERKDEIILTKWNEIKWNLIFPLKQA